MTTFQKSVEWKKIAESTNPAPQDDRATDYFSNVEYAWEQAPIEWHAPITNYTAVIDIWKCCEVDNSGGKTPDEHQRDLRRIMIALDAWESIAPATALAAQKANAAKSAAAAAETAKTAAPGTERGLYRFIIEEGKREEIVMSLGVVIGRSGKYYKRGGRLVRLLTIPASIDDKGTRRAAGSIIIRPAEVAALVSDVSRYTELKKWNAKVKRNVVCDLPVEVAQSLVSLGAEDPNIDELRGVVYCPILLPDGSIVSQTGYNKKTQLYFSSDADWSGFSVPDRPTHQ